ncbi:hypothetical protein AA23498_1429 [Acetobacter nitrogenifigens DSM 23921 = NBRC 105050]|nr:hypothetical protein [Acetobacter nitrogenifigens]GBQ92350.1 hypothetical protein AA23498_1429 [Acetobacter nitrogenifigens DSM 23921 = NBRC 105050]
MSENLQHTLAPRRSMGLQMHDLLAVLYLALVTWLVIYLVQNVHDHPFILAYVKFLLLATFGECLKKRITQGTWMPDHLILRALIWGCFGVWIATSFMILDSGVRWLVSASSPSKAITAFAISAWMNVFSGYGFFMMLTHFITDRMIDEGVKNPVEYMRSQGFARWAKIVFLCLIFFWTPAHTITFLLPNMWRVVFAAYLGIALGAILSFASDPGARTPRAA